MKKRSLFLAVVLTAVALFGCSKDGEETVIESGQEAYLRELATTLNGSWKGELYSSATNTTEHEDIVFKKWDKPQEVVSREDKRSIELLDGNSFNMRTYGTGEATSLHYTRQN